MVQKDKIIESSQPEGEANPVPAEAVADTQSPVDEPSIGVERTGRRKFLTGVVEGEQTDKASNKIWTKMIINLISDQHCVNKQTIFLINLWSVYID